MINIISVFDDVTFQINKDGGYLSIADFNALSKRAELKLLDFICGDEDAVPITNIQKNVDRKSDFKVAYLANVSGGYIKRPDDYYQFDELFRINGNKKDCEGDKYVPNQPIELLESSKFTYRGKAFIEELKPINKPIAKEIKIADVNRFEFLPRDIGSVQLTYIRLPIFGNMGAMMDNERNDEIPDPDTSINYEWGEWARELLIFTIVQAFSQRTREAALFQINQASHQPVK